MADRTSEQTVLEKSFDPTYEVLKTGVYGTDGTNLQRLKVDAGGNLKTSIVDAGGDAVTVTGGKLDVNATINATAGPIADGVDSNIKATVKDLTNSNPLTVAIMDGSGDQITSFGGGTQYTEGDTDATITGTAVMWEDAANTLVVASSAKPLPVSASIDTTGLATSATDASTASIDTKTPALGQALAAASTPVVLTAAQLTTLTPPAAITGFATSPLI